jgi:hypothetical protein
MSPSPDQMRRIEAARKTVDEFWYTDLKTKELRRKPLHGWKKLLNLFWKRRHNVGELYWWIRFRQAEADMMPFHNPINSDNMPIEGFPMKYELQGGWTIPESDLKYLKKGPLASEGLTEILVPAELGWQRFVQFFRQFGVVISGVIAILGTAIRYWDEIARALGWIKNAA